MEDELVKWADASRIVLDKLDRAREGLKRIMEETETSTLAHRIALDTLKEIEPARAE